MHHSPYQRSRLIFDANDNVGLEKTEKLLIFKKVKLLNICDKT